MSKVTEQKIIKNYLALLRGAPQPTEAERLEQERKRGIERLCIIFCAVEARILAQEEANELRAPDH